MRPVAVIRTPELLIRPSHGCGPKNRSGGHLKDVEGTLDTTIEPKYREPKYNAPLSYRKVGTQCRTRLGGDAFPESPPTTPSLCSPKIEAFKGLNDSL